VRAPDPAGPAAGARRAGSPEEFDIGFRDLVARGEAHEPAVLDRFRAGGWQVAEIGVMPESEAVSAGREAIADGADVIYQGQLTYDRAGDEPTLVGYPDFLVCAGLLGAPDGEFLPGGRTTRWSTRSWPGRPRLAR
jgi:hypothetical protein